MATTSELATVYAAIILSDDGVEITVSLTKAAGVEVEPVWATLFAKALEGKNITDLLMNIGSQKAEEKKPAEEEKEESDDDMGFGLFD
ncbi:19878_t:CDS:2 [Funneliformis geosporum]|uniref:19878_t:CDS:1 n=1 Tax=Funneliformis geosporum TaxID=1117311 RepID=A0A9W4WRB6_9GLOM|nr:19878_t:CDS:2 [Funneliformis geosporum]